MTLNSRETFSIGLLGLLLVIGCGEDAALEPPAAPAADATDPDPPGSGGAAGRNAGGHLGTSSAAGGGGSAVSRDAGHAGSGARPTEGGASGSSGTAGGGSRDGGMAAAGTGGARDAGSAAHVVINEIVADPQRDWNDSAEGATPFDATPGAGTITGADEWIELYNASGAVVDLSGWTLVMTDGTPATEPIGTGDAVLVFSAGGAVASYQAGEYLIIGNPKGDLNNTVSIELYDARGLLVDQVALGGDGGPSGNATSSEDEAIARVPSGADSDDDAADFSARPPTPGAPN